MENASKALIIVGAILLSILLIGIGMVVITNSQSTMNESLMAMSTQEKQAFNAQFETYQGEEISGSNVKTLLSSLAANYSTYEDEPAKVPEVNVTGGDKTSLGSASYKATSDTGYNTSISQIRNNITNKHTYKVEMIFGDAGVIDEILITDQTTPAGS